MKRIAITFLKIRKTKTGKLGIHTPCLPVFVMINIPRLIILCLFF